MNVLLISTSYYPHIGGVEYVVKSIAERIVKMNHNVTVLAGEPMGEKPFEEEINGVSVIRWPTWSPGNAYHIPRYRTKLDKMLKKFAKDFDVVHIHSIHTVLSVWSGMKICKSGFDGKVIVTPYYHGTGHTNLRRLLWLPWRRVAKKLLEKSHVVTTVSRMEAQLIEKHFGLKAVVIENGVEEKIFDFNWNPENFVMYSGRIEKYKNIHKLGKIVKVLNEEFGYDFSMVISGDGSFKNRLLKILKGLGIEFEIRGFQPYEKYIKLLSRARFFGLISEKESYPQSVNEANAIGVPVVIARPWGMNFEGRSRTLVIDLLEHDREIARKISIFIKESTTHPRPKVPSWNLVTSKYLSLYIGQ